MKRVLDTNIVLDLWVFDEPQAEALRVSVETGHTHWLATAAMREELARVLAYPQIAKRLTHRAGPNCSPTRPKPNTPAKTPTTRNSSTWPSPTPPPCTARTRKCCACASAWSAAAWR